MEAPLIVAVTVNTNQSQHTLRCLESLSAPEGYRLCQLVVDNGSTDSSAQAIALQKPEVEQLIHSTDIGYTRGMNAGFRWALEHGADYIFVINNDSWIAPDTLQVLASAIAPANVGAVSPIIYTSAPPHPIWSAGAGRSSLTLDLTNNHGTRDQLIQVLDCEYVSPCAMLLKRSTLEQVGLFDERFFRYYEDSDFCLRVRRAGLRLLIVPQARAWYEVGASSGGADTPAERYWLARSSVQFFRKHVRGWRWLVVAPYRFASAFMNSIRLLLARKPASVGAHWRGLWDGLRP